MPDSSAECIVTSPPYRAKRDYGIKGQYGLEAAPAGYVATLRAVSAQARRVLADDGTCWLNLGDSYSAGNGTPHGLHSYVGHGLVGRQAAGLGTKNLLGLPWRVALALQDDGRIIRNAVVWHKDNAMPESVRDRGPGSADHRLRQDGDAHEGRAATHLARPDAVGDSSYIDSLPSRKAPPARR